MNDMQSVYLITGLPGSGKTELTKAAQIKLRCLHLSSEELRCMLFDLSPDKNDVDFSPNELSVVYDLIPVILRDLLSKGHSVIIEGVFRSRMQRSSIESICKSMSVSMKKYLVCADRNEIITRLVKRKNNATIEPAGVRAFEMIEKKFEMPGDDYKVIDTTYLSPSDLVKYI